MTQLLADTSQGLNGATADGLAGGFVLGERGDLRAERVGGGDADQGDATDEAPILCEHHERKVGELVG